MVVPETAAVGEMVGAEATVTKDEGKAVKRGLYRVFWKQSHGGGESIAAVGSTPSGTRWLAACNWVGFATDQDKIDAAWEAVERLETIEVIDVN